MIAVLLLMFAAGIGLSQAVSDPNQVTLRWLRLGGILAVTFIALAAMILALYPIDVATKPHGALVISFDVPCVCLLLPAAQLVMGQLGHRRIQRVLAALGFVILVLAGTHASHMAAISGPPISGPVGLGSTRLLVATILSSGLLGGFLMTMLLGHAYLTAGNEMTQAPFRRLVIMLAILLLARAGLSVACGLWPYLIAELPRQQRMWNTVMLTARYAVGLIVPAIFTYMTYDCVRRRANQSATGILYVAAVLVIVGEGIALALLGSTGYVF